MFKRAATVMIDDTPHDHIIYITEDGSGTTTVARGHSHIVIPIDLPSPDGSVQSAFQVQPAIDGHTHEVEDIGTSEFKLDSEETQDDYKVVMDLWNMRKQAVEWDRTSRERADEMERYIYNEQWPIGEKSQLEKEGRPALTINIIRPKLSALEGYQRNNRTDMKMFPVEGGDQRAADLMTQVSKVILDQTNFWQEESEVFADEIGPGMGVFKIWIDNDEDPNGIIKISQCDWKNIYMGPHLKRDASDLEFLIEEELFSKEKLIRMYPEYEDEIKVMFTNTTTASNPSNFSTPEPYRNDFHEILIDSSVINRNAKTVKLITRWMKEFERFRVFVDLKTGYSEDLYKWKPADVSALKTIPNVTVVDRVGFKMRVTTIAGNLKLDDKYINPKYDYNGFHHFVVYAEKKRNIWQGRAIYLKDLQDQFNKNKSVESDILNKVNGYGWFYDEDTFSDENDATAFKRISKKPGFIQKLKDLAKRPERVEGVKYPAELERAMQSDIQLAELLINVNAELLGSAGGAESGVALLEKKKSALLGNEFVFDNLAMCKKQLGRALIIMIQKVYGGQPERIGAILNNEMRKGKKIQIAGQDAQEYTIKEIDDILNNSDLSKIDIIVEETTQSPTYKIAQFAFFSELKRNGVPIPDDIYVESIPGLDDSQKAKMLQQLQAQAQASAQAEQAKNQTEIIKSLPDNEKAALIQGQSAQPSIPA